MTFFSSFFTAFALISFPVCAQNSAAVFISTDPVLPAYWALSSGVKGFNLFADGGPDANWYIGFNNAWIIRLPPIPAGTYARAFIGAKIGRAKSIPDADRPWLKDAIDGKIYMAISQTPAFSSEQSYFLVETPDLPREADPQVSVLGSGAARWFWTEIPVSMVSNAAPNYLIIWSPSPEFTSAVNSPILAASNAPTAFCSPAPCSWNNHSILGVPPRQASDSLETPLSQLLPALAIKLVPPETAGRGGVGISAFEVSPQPAGLLVRVSVTGEDVDGAWLEVSHDDLDWERFGAVLREPPFLFSLTADHAPQPGEYLRAAGHNSFGTVAHSQPYVIPYPAR